MQDPQSISESHAAPNEAVITTSENLKQQFERASANINMTYAAKRDCIQETALRLCERSAMSGDRDAQIGLVQLLEQLAREWGEERDECYALAGEHQPQSASCLALLREAEQAFTKAKNYQAQYHQASETYGVKPSDVAALKPPSLPCIFLPQPPEELSAIFEEEKTVCLYQPTTKQILVLPSDASLVHERQEDVIYLYKKDEGTDNGKVLVVTPAIVGAMISFSGNLEPQSILVKGVIPWDKPMPAQNAVIAPPNPQNSVPAVASLNGRGRKRKNVWKAGMFGASGKKRQMDHEAQQRQNLHFPPMAHTSMPSVGASMVRPLSQFPMSLSQFPMSQFPMPPFLPMRTFSAWPGPMSGGEVGLAAPPSNVSLFSRGVSAPFVHPAFGVFGSNQQRFDS